MVAGKIKERTNDNILFCSVNVDVVLCAFRVYVCSALLCFSFQAEKETDFDLDAETLQIITMEADICCPFMPTKLKKITDDYNKHHGHSVIHTGKWN